MVAASARSRAAVRARPLVELGDGPSDRGSDDLDTRRGQRGLSDRSLPGRTQASRPEAGRAIRVRQCAMEGERMIEQSNVVVWRGRRAGWHWATYYQGSQRTGTAPSKAKA